MKGYLLFLFFIIPFEAISSTFICLELPEERVIKSEVQISPFSTDIGFQYILSIPNVYDGFEFTSATVMQSENEGIKLFFSPDMKLDDEVRTSVVISHQKFEDTQLTVKYGEVCEGNGYSVTYEFSTN